MFDTKQRSGFFPDNIGTTNIASDCLVRQGLPHTRQSEVVLLKEASWETGGVRRWFFSVWTVQGSFILSQVFAITRTPVEKIAFLP